VGDDLQIVTAAVLIEDSRLFLARRGPGEKLAGFWELPGGKLEPGESPAECLERELLEELAMRTKIGAVIAETVHVYEHGRFRMLAIKTKRLSGFQLTVHDRFAWVARAELDAYQLAPADVALILKLITGGFWS